MKRPFLYIVVSFSLGIIAARIFSVPIAYPFAFTAIFTALAFLSSKSRLASHLNLYAAILFLGVVYCQNSITPAADHITNITHKEPERVFLKGVVVDDPVTTTTFYKNKRTSLTLKVDSYKEDAAWRASRGLVRVDLYLENVGGIDFGNEVILEGLISRPRGLKNPGIFDFSRYMELKGIYSVLKVKEGSTLNIVAKNRAGPIEAAAHIIRRAIRDLFDRYFEPSDSGFLKAIFIGERTALDTDIKDDFVKTGTVHILAISGLNVALIAAIVLAIFGLVRIPKKPGLVFALALLIVYTFVAGSSPPIVRATVMFAVFVIGYLIDRSTDTLNSLSLAAFIMLLWNPRELFDPSFQLSFVSLAGLIIFTPKINELLKVGEIGKDSILDRLKLYTLEGISVSVSAWLASWPFIAAYFNIVSFISIAANLIIIPLLSVIMALSFAFLSAACASELLASVFARALYATEQILFFVNHIMANFKFSSVHLGAPGIIFSAAYYAAILAWLIPDRDKPGRAFMRKRNIYAAILLILNILVWKEAAFKSTDVLKATFLDVGQGDSAFVELPGGGKILIDGGSGGDGGKPDMGRSVIAPFLWNKGIFNIDMVIATHFHEDHIGGLIYILKNFKVGLVADNGASSNGNKIHDDYLAAIRERKIRRIIIREGDEIDLSGGVKAFVLNPEREKPLEDSNDNSIALKMAYKDLSILFCADIQAGTMARLESYGPFLESDVVKMPHHGGGLGREKDVVDFFSLVSPKYLIISTGERYQLSGRKILGGMGENFEVYVTKSNGAITVIKGPDAFYVKPYEINKN